MHLRQHSNSLNVQLSIWWHKVLFSSLTTRTLLEFPSHSCVKMGIKWVIEFHTVSLPLRNVEHNVLFTNRWFLRSGLPKIPDIFVQRVTLVDPSKWVLSNWPILLVRIGEFRFEFTAWCKKPLFLTKIAYFHQKIDLKSFIFRLLTVLAGLNSFDSFATILNSYTVRTIVHF